MISGRAAETQAKGVSSSTKGDEYHLPRVMNNPARSTLVEYEQKETFYPLPTQENSTICYHRLQPVDAKPF